MKVPRCHVNVYVYRTAELNGNNRRLASYIRFNGYVVTSFAVDSSARDLFTRHFLYN